MRVASSSSRAARRASGVRLERRDVLGTQKERAVAQQVSKAEGGRERQRQLAALVLYEITEGGGETAGEGAA